MSQFVARSGALVFAAVLILSAAQAAHADTFIGGTNVWMMVGTPSFSTSGIAPAGATMWSNGLSVNVTGIVLMVVRNSSNQTVYYSPSSVTIAPGAIGSASNVEFGLSSGTYTATFFAMTFGGVAISAPTSVVLTVH